MPAIRSVELHKRFAETVAADGVNLAVEQGEVRGLLGPNGAGKTTLLRMLFGLIRPDSGSIQMFGRPLNAGVADALRGVAGFVEEPSFYPYLSGRANLRLLARLDGAGAGASEIDGALGRVGLDPHGDNRVAGYSTGMRQRLGIAAALLRAPRALLLDEPTSGLDPAGARAVAALVRELADEGVAILISSHQIGELELICTSFTFLRDGRVVWDGTAAELEGDAPPSAYTLATSDDQLALEVIAGKLRTVARRSPRGGLTLTATTEALDAIVQTLGQAGLSMRRLELTVSPLESMYFALTGVAPSQDHGSWEEAEGMLLRS